jgi:hypothetical protein
LIRTIIPERICQEERLPGQKRDRLSKLFCMLPSSSQSRGSGFTPGPSWHWRGGIPAPVPVWPSWKDPGSGNMAWPDPQCHVQVGADLQELLPFPEALKGTSGALAQNSAFPCCLFTVFPSVLGTQVLRGGGGVDFSHSLTSIVLCPLVTSLFTWPVATYIVHSRLFVSFGSASWDSAEHRCKSTQENTTSALNEHGFVLVWFGFGLSLFPKQYGLTSTAFTSG